MIGSISSNTYAKYVGILKWGSDGYGEGQFYSPGGVAVDSKGDVYVADAFRIQKFHLANPCPGGTTQVFGAPGVCFVIQWGSQGGGDGQFKQPSGVAVDSKGDVYVADTFNNRIQKFHLANPCPGGTTQVPGAPGVCFVIKWGGLQPGAGDGQFDSPAGVAVDSSGNVYVAEHSSNSRIQKFQLANPCPGGTTQVPGAPGVCFVIKWGSQGGAVGYFAQPSDVAVDSKGDVYVPEYNSHRIQKFHLANPCPGGTTFVVPGVCFVIKWGGLQPGSGNGQFQFPQGIAVDSSGNVFVADTDNNRIQKIIQKFPPTGTTVIVPFTTEWGSKGSGDDQFYHPSGVAVAPTPGGVAVAPTQNICSVDIAWYNGNARVYHFVIATSTDGTTFTNVFSGDSSGTTLNSEKYIIPNTNARYVRVTVNGNTANDWASMTELDVFGSSSPPGSCTTNLPISGVTASGNDGNLPQNVLDGSLSTRWSSQGNGQFITANLASGQIITPYVESSGNVYVADTFNNRIQVFIDDIIPPKVTIKDPIDGTTLTAPVSEEIRAGATDNVKVKQVEFYANSIKGGNVMLGTDTSPPYGFPLKGLSPDTYTLTAKAYDTADNTQISTAVTVDIK